MLRLLQFTSLASNGFETRLVGDHYLGFALSRIKRSGSEGSSPTTIPSLRTLRPACWISRRLCLGPW